MQNQLNPLCKSIAFLMLSFFFLVQCETGSSGTKDLEAGFVDPAKENRALALWPWLNGYVDTMKLVYELEQMKEKGMRGALIWDVGALIDQDQMIPAGPALLGDSSLQYFSLALRTGNRLDLDIGWFASSSWNAGGPWVHEANASMELISSSQLVEGPSKQKVIITKPKSKLVDVYRYSLISTVAVPHNKNKEIDYSDAQTVLLNDFTFDEKYIEWEVPEGKWEILSFFMSNTGQKLVCPSPNSSGLIIDHLSREATKNNFDSILTRLAPVIHADHQLKFFMLDSYEVWKMKDWSPLFVREFKSRYGYDPLKYLPLLEEYKSTDPMIDERFRGDYHRLVSDMMIENHFAQSVEIADKNGFEMLTEAGHGGNVRVDPLKALGNSHIPMGEFWNRQRHWVTKEAASAAHIYGKKIVASESLTGWNHWQHGPTDFKQLCDIAFCEGLNQLVFHTFAHNPEMAGKPGFVYHAGEHINVNATWWPFVRPFMDYLARCSYMLREGNFVADVLLYYGDDAPNLVPPTRMDPNYTPDMPGIFPEYFYDDDRCPHCGMYKPIHPGKLTGYEYDYINADVITSKLRAENGKFVLPHGQSYKIMLLPDREHISLEVLKSLEKLVYNGAVIIGRKPERASSLKNYPDCDQEVKKIANDLWEDCDGERVFSNSYGKGTVYWGKSLQEVLGILDVYPDVEVKGIDNCDNHIDFHHRQTDREDIYFVSNSSEKEEMITCVFRVVKSRVPEIWDAETGLIQRDVEYSKVGNGISIKLKMDPLASRFVVFRNQSSGINDEGLYYDLQYGFKHSGTAGKNNRIDLSHDWEVSFDTEMGGPKSYLLDKLTSWTDVDHQGIKYYSGTANYHKYFSIDEDVLSNSAEAFVVFEEIQEMAHVFVNGNDCGVVWLPPYKTNITNYLKAGRNKITVQVVNTWNNRIVGDKKNPDKKPFTNTNAKVKFTESSPLLKSGLMGNAQIIFMNN